MKREQNVQALTLSNNGKQTEQLTPVDTAHSDKFKKKEFNLRPDWTSIQPAIETDEFNEVEQKRGLNLRPIWRTIQRNFLLISGFTTIVTATTFYLGLNSPRIYEGDFRLLVEPITSEAKLTDPSVLSRDQQVATGINVDYPTLLEVLQSPGLLSEVAKQVQARYPDVSYDSLSLDLVSKNLVIQRIGTNLSDFTKLIEVRYKGEDAAKVQFVLEELAKGYLKYSLENRKTRIGLGVQFIEDQLPRLQQQVNDLQGKVQTLQQHYTLSDPASDGAALSQQLREIQAQRLETQRQLEEQKTLYANLQKQLKLAPNEVIAASTLSEDPHYQELLTQLKKIESQIAVESAQFTEENPALQSLREKQKSLSLLLKQESGRIVGQKLSTTTANPQVMTFQNSLRQGLIKQMVDTANQAQVLEVRNQAVTQTEAWLEQQVRIFPAITRQYNDLQRQLEIATKTLNQLLIQRETLRVEAAQKEVPWQVVSQPRIPHDAAGNLIPADSDTAKKLAMGVMAGFMLGLGVALLKEKYRNVFYSAEDIQDAITELPLLEVSLEPSVKQFPNYSVGARAIEGTETEDSDASLLLQTFSSLYTSIRFLASKSPVHSLVVGSAEPGDGKTTIALELAKAAASMGQRVLLVDANLCQPQLHTRLGLPNLQGLSNILSGNLEPKELIQRSPLEENLFVLTAGQQPPNSTRLLASTRMQPLVEQLQSAFDLVIYDTPHLLGLPDANFLAAHTDGILMVVRVGKTSRSLLTQVLNKLNSFHLPILGIVANHVEESTNSASGSHHHHYEQNHQGSSTFVKKPKEFKSTLLTAGKQTTR
jgi:capsular exopolysaccharide synthesis family protein